MEGAEQAAQAGDAARAESLLREALRLQLAELGPTHADLASTFNNLAVVCESNGKLDDAEAFYRRACAVASSSRPAGDPLVVTSRDNLRDFCAARGRSLEDWPGPDEPERTTGAMHAPVTAPDPTASEPGAVAPALEAASRAPAITPPSRPQPPSQVRPLPPPVANVGQAAPGAPTPAKPARAIVMMATVAVLAVVGAIWLWRSGDAAVPPPGSASSPSQTAPPPVVAQPLPSVTPQPATPSAGLADGDAAGTPDRVVPRPAAPAIDGAPPDTPRIVTAAVCADLTTRGSWRCIPLATPAASGRASFFTRIASARPLRVEHRWYQGSRLRQQVVLSVGASAREGYRTYSRQTLSPGAWRVELRAANGTVLHESTFDVR